MSSILDQIQQAADAKLLEWLTNGKEDTNPITGETTTRDLSAAEMACVIKRLGQKTESGIPISDPLSNAIASKVRSGNLRIAGMPRAETA